MRKFVQIRTAIRVRCAGLGDLRVVPAYFGQALFGGTVCDGRAGLPANPHLRRPARIASGPR